MTDFQDIDVRLVLGRLRPTSEYHWKGGRGDKGYAALSEAIGAWRDEQTSPPTEAELIAEWEAYTAEQDAAEQSTAEAVAKLEASKIEADQVGEIDPVKYADPEMSELAKKIAYLEQIVLSWQKTGG